MRDFLDLHAALVTRLARHAVRGGREALDADDVAHEVFVGLLRMHAQGTFDPSRVENPEAYLRTVVRNAANRARIRGKRGFELTREGDVDATADAQLDAEAAETPEDATSRALDARRVIEAMKRRLRPRDAVAFAMLVEDGLSIDEVATALGTTTNNVYQMRHRILAAATELAATDEAIPALGAG